MPRLPNPAYMQHPPPAGVTRAPGASSSSPFFPSVGALLFSGFGTPSTLSNFAVDTLFTQFTMAANTITALGAMLRIRGSFIFSTLGTPALDVKCWLGGLLGLKVFDRGVTATQNNCANVAIIVDVTLRWDSGPPNAANFGFPGGFIIIPDKSATAGQFYIAAQVTAPIGLVDLTAPLTVGFSAAFDAADPANTITEETLMVEALFPAVVG